MKRIAADAAGVSLGFATGARAFATPVTDIKVSYQPALYWALPFYVAAEKGWWASSA